MCTNTPSSKRQHNVETTAYIVKCFHSHFCAKDKVTDVITRFVDPENIRTLLTLEKTLHKAVTCQASTLLICDLCSPQHSFHIDNKVK